MENNLAEPSRRVVGWESRCAGLLGGCMWSMSGNGAEGGSGSTLTALPDSSPTPWAQRLLQLERTSGGALDGWSDAAARVHDKTVERLAPLLGLARVHALIQRSARLAQGTHPCLTEPTLVEGSAWLRACLHGQPPDLALACAVSLFGTFFDLLERLIGQPLTRQILRVSWPALAEASREEISSIRSSARGASGGGLELLRSSRSDPTTVATIGDLEDARGARVVLLVRAVGELDGLIEFVRLHAVSVDHVDRAELVAVSATLVYWRGMLRSFSDRTQVTTTMLPTRLLEAMEGIARASAGALDTLGARLARGDPWGVPSGDDQDPEPAWDDEE